MCRWRGKRTLRVYLRSNFTPGSRKTIRNLRCMHKISAMTPLWKSEANGMHPDTLCVLKPNVCHVLVRSRALVGEDPDRMGILAVEFSVGRGHVLHLVGHFDNDSGLGFVGPNSIPDSAPVIGISLRQALAANFIV